MVVYKGGYHTYGKAVGILMTDTGFPRIPGDIGNAATFPFPVMYRTVRGATPRRIVMESDPTLLEPFITAARELEAEGARAITTACGFMALFHRQMAEAISVPLISSSLMQIPMVSRMVGGRPVGILTARQSTLTEHHFNGVGWSARETTVVIKGMDDAPLFSIAHQKNLMAIDFDQMREEVVGVARQMVEERPEVAAIVMECTNMTQYADSVQQAVDRPVFSIATLVKMVYAALERREFVGHM